MAGTGAGSGLLTSMLEKLNLFQFDRYKNYAALDVKMDGSVFEENHLLRCWEYLSFLNWIWARTLSLLLKLPPRKLET